MVDIEEQKLKELVKKTYAILNNNGRCMKFEFIDKLDGFEYSCIKFKDSDSFVCGITVFDRGNVPSQEDIQNNKLFVYDLRHGDDWGIPATVEKSGSVRCDFYGRFICDKEIEFPIEDGEQLDYIEVYDYIISDHPIPYGLLPVCEEWFKDDGMVDFETACHDVTEYLKFETFINLRLCWEDAKKMIKDEYEKLVDDITSERAIIFYQVRGLNLSTGKYIDKKGIKWESEESAKEELKEWYNIEKNSDHSEQVYWCMDGYEYDNVGYEVVPVLEIKENVWEDEGKEENGNEKV